MAAPTFVAAGARTTATTGAMACALPTGIQADDILILAVQTANQAISTPSGYTEIGTQARKAGGTAAASGSSRLCVFWKRAGSSESAPSTSAVGNHQTGQMYAFRGCATSGDPWDFQAELAGPFSTTCGWIGPSASGGSTTCYKDNVLLSGGTSISTLGADRLMVWIAGHAIDSNSAQASAPTINVSGAWDSITEGAGADVAYNGGVGGGLVLHYGTKASSGVVLDDGASYTVSCTLAASGGWVPGQFLALKPPVTPVSRTATEAPTTSDAITRITSLARPITEPPTTSESVERVGSFQRTRTEAPTTSDSVSAVKTIQRTASEAPTTSDSATAVVTGVIARSASEAISTSDTATRTTTAIRSITENPTTSESATRTGTFVRSVGGAFAFSRAITIDHTKCGSSNSTDFPMLVSVTDNTLKSVANGGHVQSSSGYDIRLYSDAGLTNALSYELERYNPSTGEVVLWVKIPTLSSSSDVTIYLAYGNPNLTTDGSSVNTWSNGFLGVYHFKDGTTLDVNSATGSNNGTNHSATAVAGKIDGAASFASASGHYIDDGTGMNPTSITYSAWVNGTSFPNAYNAICGRVNSGASDYSIFYIKSNGKMTISLRRNAGNIITLDGTGSVTLSTGTWYHVAMTFDENLTTAATKGFINGSQDLASGSTAAFQLINTSAPTNTARDANSTTLLWNGPIDEVRVSSVARSADWILAEYNNQNSPSTFYSLGSEVSIGGDALSTSDSVIAAKSLVRSTSEAPTTSEARTRIATLVRSITEAPTTNDSPTASVSGALSRSATEALSTSENVTRTLTGVRSATENPTTADVATKAASRTRTAAEAPTTADAAARIQSAQRTTTEASVTADVATRTISTQRTATETPTTSETRSRILTAVRATTEAPVTSDSASKTATFVRSCSEALVTADSATRAVALIRSTTEALTTSDVASQSVVHGGLSRTATESVSTSDSAVRTLATARTTSENISTAESISRTTNKPRTVTEAPTTSEARTRILAAVRSTTESLAATGIITRIVSTHLTTTEAISTADVAIKSGAMITRSTVDSLNTAEVVTRLLGASRSTSETLSSVAVAGRLVVLYRLAVENIVISESVIGVVIGPTLFNYFVDMENGQQPTRSVVTSQQARSDLGGCAAESELTGAGVTD